MNDKTDPEDQTVFDADTGEIIEPIITMLQEMHAGDFATHLTEQLKELVKEIMFQHNEEGLQKEGHMTIKIKLQTMDMEYTPLKVWGECSIKKTCEKTFTKYVLCTPGRLFITTTSSTDRIFRSKKGRLKWKLKLLIKLQNYQTLRMLKYTNTESVTHILFYRRGLVS